MKISIITVAYNSAATIADTLRSVAAQTYPDIEHIVIDGASTDDTLTVVKAHGRHVQVLVSERDHGIYDAMNKGLALASGQIVGFLNSDDMLADPGAVTRIAQGFSATTVDAVYGDLVFVDPIDTARVVRYWQPGPYRTGLVPKGWMPPHPTFYVRRDVLRANGGFNVDYRLQADFDLMLRLFEIAKIRSNYLPSTLVRMRIGGATTGSIGNIVRGNLEAANACRQHGYPGGIGFILGKLARRVPQFFNRAPRT